MSELSPDAQAVYDAYRDHWTVDPYEVSPQALGDALRAIVRELKYFGITERNIIAIANELDPQ